MTLDMFITASRLPLLLAAMTGFVLAALSLPGFMRPRLGRSGPWCFAAGAALVGLSLIGRAILTAHLPLQNLYDVFLAMALLMYPLSLAARRLLGVGGEALDALLAAVLLVPVAFVFSPEPQQLPPALQSWLFGPHVMAYLLSYVLIAKAAIQAGRTLLAEPPQRAAREAACSRLVAAAFPLMTLGLVLGAVWGRRAWGDWWNWDPKELWSLATWLAVAGTLHLRTTLSKPRPRLQASLALLAFALVVVTLLWANLGRIFQGLHSYAV